MIVMMPHLTAAGTNHVIIICYRCGSCPMPINDLEMIVVCSTTLVCIYIFIYDIN